MEFIKLLWIAIIILIPSISFSEEESMSTSLSTTVTLKLQAITEVDGKNSAIINGELVGEGDIVNNYKVKKIHSLRNGAEVILIDPASGYESTISLINDTVVEKINYNNGKGYEK